MHNERTGSGNVVERRKDRVIKTFGSRLRFAREQGVYEKLKNTALTPKLLFAQDGVIETQYVEGLDFQDVYLAAGTDPQKQTACFEAFFSWYKRYREAVNLSLGAFNLHDFILGDEGLLGVDFDQCRPGSVEDDVARLACLLAVFPRGYTAAGLESAKLAVCVASGILDWQPETLAKAVPAAAERIEKQYELKRQPGMARYLASYFTAAGVVLAGGRSSRMMQDKRMLEVDGRTMLETSASLIASMPQRILSVERESEVQLPGFETVMDEQGGLGPIEGIVCSLKRSRQPWTLFLTCDMPLLNDKLLRLFLSFPRDDVDAFLFESQGMRQTFPLLLRTENAVRAMEEALRKGERKVLDVLEKRMKSKTIRAEDFAGFVPRMLWNVNTPQDYQEVTENG